MRKILKEENCISFIETNISFEQFKKETEKFSQLMTNLNNDFIILQLYKGDKLLEYGKEKGIYEGEDYLQFKHSKGSALIRAYSFGYKKNNGQNTSIDPAISISTADFLNGWTFGTGLFSDVYLIESVNGYLSFSTRDTLYIHNLYIYWIIEQLEKEFNIYKIEKKEVTPFHRNMRTMLNLTEPIREEFDEYINRNKSKRIDKLNVNNLSVQDYIKEKIKHKYAWCELDIFKCCMIYGKPYKQVKKYMNKVLE